MDSWRGWAAERPDEADRAGEVGARPLIRVFCGHQLPRIVRRGGRTVNRFIIPAAEADRGWLEWWSYLVPSPGIILGLSPFGDWFLAQQDGQVWRVYLLEGTFRPLSVSAEEFWGELLAERAQDEWLQVGHVVAL